VKEYSFRPKMGNVFTIYPDFLKTPCRPCAYDPPSFDPMLGFPNGRKERVMIASEEDMISAKIDLEDRDYCAHLLLNFMECQANAWPFPVKCAHEKHIYNTCEYEDYIMRMKEFERERRLKERQERKEKKRLRLEGGGELLH